MNIRDPCSQLARWNLLLQEYDYEIDRKTGKAYTNADALSHMNIVEANDMVGDINLLTMHVPAIDKYRLRDEQLRDVVLAHVIEPPVTDPQLKHIYQVNRQGTLCWVSGECVEGRQKFPNERIVVSNVMVTEVLKAYHDAPYSGHYRKRKTRQKLGRRYYWVGMKKDIVDYRMKCESCQLRKTSRQRRRAPLQIFGTEPAV